MKHTVIGTLAHVDAGKTTLSESMLYTAGSIQKYGRVDHKDAFLDFDEQERNRGITIYSKQAMLTWKNTSITLIDTPGHVDFSAEMERTLQILDYAIIVINALDGIQVHTETIWKLLQHYEIPTFLFINKMDIAHVTKEQLMQEIEEKLSSSCIDFSEQGDAWLEKISLCDDALLDEYLESQTLSLPTLRKAISTRTIFPCFFGSALKMHGIEAFLEGLHTYTNSQQYPKDFGAKIYKITRDEQGNRLTHMKITGGSLKAKQKLNDFEKVDQIRLYSGVKYQMVNEVEAGRVCAVKGIKQLAAGEGLGFESNASQAVLSSYLNYKVKLPQGCDVVGMYRNFLTLAEEDPQLCVRYKEVGKEITIQLMGEIQIEVLRNRIKDRFQIEVDFEQSSVVYKETLREVIEGVGHYEPLRHYAEVHLLLTPLPRNSGLQFESACSQDVLPLQWQRLILSHLQEKEHLGVLTGSAITDLKITLLAGKAHLKHTEGQDFLQAAYRALRQGLKAGESILLEPYYQFRITLPSAYVSKAMHDLELRNAQYHMQEENGIILLSGTAPVSAMQNYQTELYAYTKGQGKLYCVLSGYEECKQTEEIITQIGYDSEHDLENPTGSIFCAHGAGYFVPWNEVYAHMHIKEVWKKPVFKQEIREHRKIKIEDAEVERVMRMTYGEPKQQLRKKRTELNKDPISTKEIKPQCFLIDGYNIVHDWDELKALAKDNLDAARNRLIHYMSSFQGYKKCLLILVFDAYKVPESIQKEYYNGSIYIVYTKTAQTADSYIEKTTRKLADDYQITVATSDALEQLIVNAQGARRMSTRELKKEFDFCSRTSIQEYESRQSKAGNRALEELRKLNDPSMHE